MYSGKVIIVEKDVNPLSSTYGQTRERKEDLYLCSQWRCDMRKVAEYTENATTKEVYQDKNENSPTYMQQITITQGDTTPKYLTMYYSCETTTINGFTKNTGYRLSCNIDANPNSATYQTPTENVRTEDLENCQTPNTSPIWEYVSRCEMVTVRDGLQRTDGYEITERYDRNPYSNTYNQKDSGYNDRHTSSNCERPDTAEKLLKYCEYCELNSRGENTGYKITKSKDINIFSATYMDHWRITRGLSEDCPKPPSSGMLIRGTAYNTNPIRILVNNVSEYITPNDDFSFEYELEEQPTSLANLFSNQTTLKTLDLSGLNTISVTSLSYMVASCSNLTEVNLNGCNFEAVRSALTAFQGCYNLQTIYMVGCDSTSITKISGVKPSYTQVVTT